MARILISAAAKADLTDIRRYITRQDSAEAAIEIGRRLRRRVHELQALAERGRIVPELERLGVTAIREVLEGPWRIVYHPGHDVLVIAVLDSRRDLESLLQQRAAGLSDSPTP